MTPTPFQFLRIPSEAAWGVVLAGICLGPLLAYSLPEKPFAVWPWTQTFADFAAVFIPSIDVLTQLSKMPQVTRLFMSLQWIVWGPICVALFLKFGRPTEKSMIMAMRVTQARWWYFLFAPLVTAVMGWFLFTLPFLSHGSPEDPFRMMIDAMSRSRLWLGLFGSVFVMVCAFAVVAFFKSFSLIRLAYAVRTSSPLYRKDPK